MKKIVALVLALMMVLSLGVSALALKEIELNKVEESSDGVKKIKFQETVSFDGDPMKDEVVKTNGPEGGVAFFLVNADKLKDLKAASNNEAVVKAEILDYNPETMEYLAEVDYHLARRDGDAAKQAEHWNGTTMVDKTNPKGLNRYEWIKYVANTLNKEFKTTQYYAKADSQFKVLKLTVAPNYSAAFTEAAVKLTAYNTDIMKNVYVQFKVVNDITIFAYEYVKSAAQYKYTLELLDPAQTAYSDYDTYKAGYKQADLAQIPGPRVISTTAFRAIEGKDITVSLKNADGKLVDGASSYVTIYDVAADQKGVNFSFYQKRTKEAKEDFTAAAVNGENRKLEFGFKGDQVVKSKFQLKVVLKNEDGSAMNYFDLREFFGRKLEEQDKVVYYFLKDGKLIHEEEVDYKSKDYTDPVELKFDLENTTLGQYQIVVKVPAENKGEQNPNTGAESVMGVVAAVAVVSVAAAAAVSLKK